MLSMSEWDYSPFWEETIKQLAQELTTLEFSTWFERLKYIKSEEKKIILFVPSGFYRDQVKQKYSRIIEDRLFKLSGQKISIQIEENAEEFKTQEQENLSLKEKSVPKKKEKPQHKDLNKNYTFENFIIGDNNSFATNAAMAVSKNPGFTYNPLLIYGGVGLGKTHLMQAIGNEIWKNTDLKVIYVTAEGFTNEFIESAGVVGKREMSTFKNKYRNTDVLLIDDIHFFQKKEGTQEELFHTFNALYESNKLIVFTCDRPPSELSNMEERLKSRFERGLNIDITAPKYETRCAILMKKNENSHIKIKKEIIELIAKNISSNVRDLESAFTKVVAYKEITQKDINIEESKNLLADVFGSRKQLNITTDLIQKEVAKYFNISVADIKSKKKTKSIAFPRQVAMYLCREMTECSTTELGEEFGGKDHTTIIHGFQKIEKQMISEPSLQEIISQLQNIIKKAINN